MSTSPVTISPEFKPSYAQVVARPKPSFPVPVYEISETATRAMTVLKSLKAPTTPDWQASVQTLLQPLDVEVRTSVTRLEMPPMWPLEFDLPKEELKSIGAPEDFLVKQTKCNWKAYLLASISIISGIALAVFARRSAYPRLLVSFGAVAIGAGLGLGIKTYKDQHTQNIV